MHLWSSSSRTDFRLESSCLHNLIPHTVFLLVENGPFADWRSDSIVYSHIVFCLLAGCFYYFSGSCVSAPHVHSLWKIRSHVIWWWVVTHPKSNVSTWASAMKREQMHLKRHCSNVSIPFSRDHVIDQVYVSCNKVKWM